MDSNPASSEVGEGMQTGVTGLKEKCPAFKDSCPFDMPAAKQLKEQSKDCPIFNNGCPFGNNASIQDIYDQLSKMPDIKEGSPHQKAMTEVLKLIHSVSFDLKKKIGQCPAFTSAQGCLFKTLCSDGKPLMHKLNDFNMEAILHKSMLEVAEDLNNDLAMEKTEKEKNGEPEGRENDASGEGIKLASDMKQGTMKVHRQAERVHFVKEFIKGRVEQKIYREAVAGLYFIYRALEDESARNREHPVFKNIHFPKELSRVASLKRDLQFYYGDDWEDEIQISDATQKYVNHLEEVGRRDPVLLIAHHYTRYLGDLSGGQILKKMAVKAYELPENGDGVHFYEFENIADHTEFKNMYRSKLDSLKVDQETADRLVEEAKMSFSLNINLFKELDRLAGFEEEIIHEEVEMVPRENTTNRVPGTENSSHSASSTSKHVSKEPKLDWLKLLAAVLVAVAVLFGVALNLMGKQT